MLAVAGKHAGQPRRAAVGTGTGFVHLRVLDGLDLADKTAGVAIGEDQANGRVQRQTVAFAGGGEVAGTQQRLEVVVAGAFHIVGVLAQQIDQNLPGVVLGGGVHLSTGRGGSDFGREITTGGVQRGLEHRRGGEGGVTVEVVNNLLGEVVEFLVLHAGESQRDMYHGLHFWDRGRRRLFVDNGSINCARLTITSGG